MTNINKMNYELAKQMKDAGYQNITLCRERCEPRGLGTGNCYNCHYPTLEELIQACEDDFFGLTIKYIPVGEGVEPQEPTRVWIAEPFFLGEHVLRELGKDLQKHHHDIFEEGRTPSEAVAKLWISIQRGKQEM